MTTKFYPLLFALCLLSVVSCRSKISTDDNDYVMTVDADVQKYSATLKGRIFSAVDRDALTETGFFVSDQSGFRDKDARTVPAAFASEEPEFTATVTLDELGVKRGDVVYYKAFIVMGDKREVASERSFIFQKIPVSSITLNQTIAGLNRGETLQLVATVTPEDATDATVVWSSSDDKVATVSQTGLVTTVGKGSATITAAAGGKEAQCEVSVRGNIPAGAVDMGLRVFWAEKPILKSENPLEYRYYAWGETTEKNAYSEATYKYLSGDFTKYCPKDNLTVLQPEDDAATAVLGKAWRIPTEKEWEELIASCNFTGGVITSKINGKHIQYVYWSGYKVNSQHYDRGTKGYYLTANIYDKKWRYVSTVTVPETGKMSITYHDRIYGMAVLAVSDGE